jgi:hypothetical protein
MTEIDPSVILKDGDCIYFRGVKYQRVEEPKPPTLYEMFCKKHLQFVSREVICEIVTEWLPDEVEVDMEEYNMGWNACLKYLRGRIR